MNKEQEDTNVNRVVVAGDVYERRYVVKFTDNLQVLIIFDLSINSPCGTINCEWSGEEAYQRRYEFRDAVHGENRTFIIEGTLWGSGGGKPVHIKIEKIKSVFCME